MSNERYWIYTLIHIITLCLYSKIRPTDNYYRFFYDSKQMFVFGNNIDFCIFLQNKLLYLIVWNYDHKKLKLIKMFPALSIVVHSIFNALQTFQPIENRSIPVN